MKSNKLLKMNNLSIIYYLAVSFFFSCKTENGCLPPEEVAKFSNPSCVVYDYDRNCYYVANRGNGTIIRKDNEICRVINSDFNQPNGMAILNNVLYVADKTKIIGVSLEHPENKIFETAISGSQYLNGIASDNDNILYITDTHKNCVFKLNISNSEYEVFASDNIISPIGILYETENNRLVVSSGAKKSPIYSIDLSTGTTQTLTVSNFDYYDFLAKDETGNYYVSCWGTHSVYKYSNNFSSEPTLFSSGHKGPAGICCNTENRIIVIPCFETNTVDFVEY